MEQKQENKATVETVTQETGSVYQSLFDKINLNTINKVSDIDKYEDSEVLFETSQDERVTMAVNILLQLIQGSSQKIEKLDKHLLDYHISQIDQKISRQLDAVMHDKTFQEIESTWRGLKFLVDRTDFRQNVKIELLDISKEDLRQDFEDAPEISQSGFYRHTYIQEYDTPGGEPIGVTISNYEFDRSSQDIALLRNISKVAASAHMPFVGSAGPKFFGKETMEEVAAIKDIGNYFDRAEYTKWNSFRETDDSRYVGLTLPRVLARLPYGPETVPVRSFNYIEDVKGLDHDRYLWANASYAFAANMAQSFVRNGWYIFLLSRIAHYLKVIQRENIGATKDRRVLELELNRWISNLVTEMTDPSDEVQASHPLREAKVIVEDIEDNPGFFRVKTFLVPHFQIEGMDINLSMVSQMPKAKN